MREKSQFIGGNNEQTAFIGFFMMKREEQGKGTGTSIIEEVCRYLKQIGFLYVRLGYIKGNMQSEHLGLKNQFKKLGIEKQRDNYTIVVLQRDL